VWPARQDGATSRPPCPNDSIMSLIGFFGVNCLVTNPFDHLTELASIMLSRNAAD
jgi:hypothetical protein